MDAQTLLRQSKDLASDKSMRNLYPCFSSNPSNSLPLNNVKGLSFANE